MKWCCYTLYAERISDDLLLYCLGSRQLAMVFCCVLRDGLNMERTFCVCDLEWEKSRLRWDLVDLTESIQILSIIIFFYYFRMY